MHEFEVEQADGLAVVLHMELAVIGKFAEDRHFDVAFGRERLEFFDLFGRNREAHALLRLRNQNLPRLKPGVLDRRLRKIHAAAVAMLGHLADAGRKAARAVVGDKAVEPAVARFADEIAELLLGDRVTDLHGLHGTVLMQLLA